MENRITNGPLHETAMLSIDEKRAELRRLGCPESIIAGIGKPNMREEMAKLKTEAIRLRAAKLDHQMAAEHLDDVLREKAARLKCD